MKNGYCESYLLRKHEKWAKNEIEKQKWAFGLAGMLSAPLESALYLGDGAWRPRAALQLGQSHQVWSPKSNSNFPSLIQVLSHNSRLMSTVIQLHNSLTFHS